MSTQMKDVRVVKYNGDNVNRILDGQGNELWSGRVLKPSLDDYTIQELAAISDYLESIQDDDYEDDPVYRDMKKFMEDDSLWCSHSQGLQPSTVTYLDTSSFDPTLADENYKCDFGQSSDKNNYVILRIIGILHDWKEDGTKAGLTLMPAKCIPFTRAYGQSGQNWVTGSLRGLLQPDGALYEMFPNTITGYIKPVRKFFNTAHSATASINHSEDYMFIASYSETYNKNKNLPPTWYANTGTGFDQTATEGYVYEYFKYKDITGSSPWADNLPIMACVYNNSGSGLGNAWSRSISAGHANYGCGWSSNGSLTADNTLNGAYGVLPCFCI